MVIRKPVPPRASWQNLSGRPDAETGTLTDTASSHQSPPTRPAPSPNGSYTQSRDERGAWERYAGQHKDLPPLNRESSDGNEEYGDYASQLRVASTGPMRDTAEWEQQSRSPTAKTTWHAGTGAGPGSRSPSASYHVSNPFSLSRSTSETGGQYLNKEVESSAGIWGEMGTAAVSPQPGASPLNDRSQGAS